MIAVAQTQLWLFQGLALAFVVLVVLAMMRRRNESGAQQDGQSRIAVAIQGASFLVLWYGPVKATLPWLSPLGVAGFAAVLLLMGAVLGLFAVSSSALGKNWSIKARTLSDHELVRRGPYAYVRHPIYLAMLLFLLAMAVALGHWLQLVAAAPFFFIGTKMRIDAEDRLLEASFGQEFVDYRNSTPALFPKIG
jgi:protein-S-isoprenylcysteine O-methyltransferase Ste14